VESNRRMTEYGSVGGRVALVRRRELIWWSAARPRLTLVMISCAGLCRTKSLGPSFFTTPDELFWLLRVGPRT
jgi:hypothetical protein